MKLETRKEIVHIRFCNDDIIYDKDERVDRLDVTLKRENKILYFLY
jgi:hypothetical protein